MSALRKVGRFGLGAVGLVCLAVGVLALGMAHLPEHPLVAQALQAMWDGAASLVVIEALGLPEVSANRMTPQLSRKRRPT